MKKNRQFLEFIVTARRKMQWISRESEEE